VLSRYNCCYDDHAGYLSNSKNPLTAITIGALQDLGYDISYDTAEPLSAVTFKSASVLAEGSTPSQQSSYGIEVPRWEILTV
jgi:hypothetical protein